VPLPPTDALNAAHSVAAGHLKPKVARREEKEAREREPVEVRVARVKHIPQRRVLLGRGAELPVEAGESDDKRRADESEHDAERDGVAAPVAEQRRAEEVANALERVLPAGEERDNLEELRVLLVGRY